MAQLESLKNQTITKAIIVTMIILLGWIIARVVSRWLAQAASKKFDTHQTMLIKRLSRYLIIALSVITGLNEAGINLSVVIGAAGVASVAIGFASQTSMSNLISGLFMVVEKPFMVGDTIKVGATTGTVSSMGLLSTILKTPENIMVRLPNENLMKSEISNLTRYPTRKVDVFISLTYAADMALARKVLIDAAQKTPGVLPTPEASIFFREFADAGIRLTISVWAKLDHVKDVGYDLPIALKAGLESAKIPYIGGPSLNT
ncbi:MAG: mechanosensitive ion channel family protein [Proteobacteria bacterium]|nr:mechanosensitive ion channel family protein [Pseudomonadota bacterium]